MAQAGSAALGGRLDQRSARPARGPGARRPILGRSTILSLSIHFAIAAFFVAWGGEPDALTVSSDEVDVDLVAPRLAPPERFSRRRGTLGGGRRVGPEKKPVASMADRAANSAAAPRSEKMLATSEHMAGCNSWPPSKAAATRRPVARRKKSEARAGLVAEHARGELSKAASLARHDRSERADDQPVAQRKPPRSRRRQPKAPLFSEALPEVDPTRLLASFKKKQDARRSRLSRFRRAQQARAAKNARIWSSFVASQRAAVASAAQLGRSGHLQRGLRGGQQVGFKFYLSGRPQPDSKVVRPPELIAFPKVTCQSINPQTTPATVRMLVTMEGTVDLAYIKNSSRSRRFDRCALKQTRGMRFLPGRDALGDPLNVWIHVRVSPALTFVAAQ